MSEDTDLRLNAARDLDAWNLELKRGLIRQKLMQASGLLFEAELLMRKAGTGHTDEVIAAIKIVDDVFNSMRKA